MSFAVPDFLYALGFLAIPILIHLFNFRKYKTVKFSQVRFLRNVRKQTQSTSRLKHIIILFCRCAAFAALIIAFAQPFIAEEELNVEKKGVIIYIDNSFSMQASGNAGSLLDEAKNKALAILAAYRESDRFQLHTNDFSGSQLRWLSKEEFTNALQQVNYSPYFRTLHELFARLQATNKEYISYHYLISDLQKINFKQSDYDDSTRYYFIPVRGKLNQNAFVKEFNSFSPYHLPNQNEQFNFTVAQSFVESKSYTGSLYINSKLKTPFSLSIEKDTANHQLTFRNPNAKFILGSIKIKDYPISFDDELFFSYNLQEPIQVLHLYSGIANKNVGALFEADSIISYQSSPIKQLDLAQLERSSMVLLDNLKELNSGIKQALSNFVTKGGSLAIFPSASMDLTSVNSFLKNMGVGYYNSFVSDSVELSNLNHSSTIFENVFERKLDNKVNLPKSTSHWEIQHSTQAIVEKIMEYRNGDSFLSKYTIGEGKIYLSAVGLSNQQSNFKDHALFVPVLFNMALQSINNKKISYFIKEQQIEVTLSHTSESPIVLEKDGIEIIPKQKIKQTKATLFIGNLINTPGHYAVKQDNKLLKYLSFNRNRKESNLEALSVEELKQYALDYNLNYVSFDEEGEFLSKTIQNHSLGKPLWKYFIILALLFLGFEILFLRILN